MRRNEKQSFGEQAARFSLYVPLAVIVVGWIIRTGDTGEKHVRSTTTTLFAINCILIAAGFLLGVIALISMRWYGRRYILGRAIGGVLLNGAAIAAMLALFLPLITHDRARQQLVGHWRLTSSPTATEAKFDMTLKGDGTFHLDMAKPAAPLISIDGQWVFTRDRVLGLAFERVSGPGSDPSTAGKKFGLGRVTSVDGERLLVKTDHGEEQYKRLP